MTRLHTCGSKGKSLPSRDTHSGQATHRRRPLPVACALQENNAHAEKPGHGRTAQTSGQKAEERGNRSPIQEGPQGHLERSQGHQLHLHGGQVLGLQLGDIASSSTDPKTSEKAIEPPIQSDQAPKGSYASTQPLPKLRDRRKPDRGR